MAGRIGTMDKKINLALIPQLLTNTNITGEWFDIARDNCFYVMVGAMALGEIATLSVMYALDRLGTTPTEYGHLHITANTLVTEALITLGTVGDVPVNGDTITVNGQIFTKAAATSVPLKTWLDAAGIAACINFWCPELWATVNTTITIKSRKKGFDTITITSSDGVKEVISTLAAFAAYDVCADVLKLKPFIAAKVATTATAQGVTVLLIQTSRKAPDVQQFAAVGLDATVIPS